MPVQLHNRIETLAEREGRQNKQGVALPVIVVCYADANAEARLTAHEGHKPDEKVLFLLNRRHITKTEVKEHGLEPTIVKHPVPKRQIDRIFLYQVNH